MNKNSLTKFILLLAIIFFISFVCAVIADYINYNELITSAPFYVNIIARAIELLIPSIMLLIGYLYTKKKYK